MDGDEIKGAAKSVGGNIKSAVGSITDDPETQAKGAIDQVVGTAQRTYGKIKDSAGGAGSALVDQLDEASTALADTVAERPLTALLVAGAIGYALAMLVRR